MAPTVNDSAPSGAGDPFSYIFGGNTGLSYEELKRRRAIASALAGQKKGFPKNTGEGLTYLGESIGEAGLNWRLAQMEKAQKEAEAGIPAGGTKLSGEPVPMVGPPGARPPASSYTPPPAVTTTAPGGVERPVTAPAPRAEADTGVAETVAAADQAPAEQPTTLAYAPSSTPDEAQLSTPVSAPPAPTPRPPVTPFFANAPLSGGGGTSLPPGGLVPNDRSFSPNYSGDFQNRSSLQAGLSRLGAQRMAETQGNALFDPNPTMPPPAERVYAADELSPLDQAAPNVAANVPIPRSRPGPAEPGVYDPGQLNPIDQAMLVRNDPRAAGVNPRILEDVAYGSLALPQGSRVELTSGQRTGDSGFHGRHSAADFHIVDPEGNVVRNRGQDTSGLYTQLARGAYTGNEKNYPGQPIAWGGAFDTAKRGGTGNRDLMHFDTGPERGNLDPSLRLSRLGPLPNDAGADPTFASVASTPRQAVANSMAIIQARDAPPSQSDAAQIARVQDVLGGGAQGSVQPRTASLGRTGVVSDEVPLGVNPVSSKIDPAIAATIQQRNAIAKELLDQQQKVPAPQEVPQTDPTSTGVTPPTTATESPASTAVEISSTSPNPQYAQNQTPGRVMDIPPAPMFDPASMAQQLQRGPVGAAPTPPPAAAPEVKPPAASPNAPPSTDPIPTFRMEQMKDPGPPPPRPNLLGASEAETYWGNVKDNPNVSPGMRAYAERQFNAHKQYRTDTQAGQINDYVNQRQQWETDVREKAKWDREEPTRILSQEIQRLAMQEAQYKASQHPAEEAKARVDLDSAKADLVKKLYESGKGLQLAQQLAEYQVVEARRKANAPVEKDLQGAIYRSQVDPVTGQQGAYSLAPGSPQPEPKALTQDQLRAAEFAIRTSPDLDRVEKELNHGKAMTYFKDGVLAAALPPGLSNKVVSDDYRRTQQALTNWGAAFMTHVSGAAYGNAEAERNLAAFIPRYGDTDQVLLEKEQRRRWVTNAAGQLAGPTGLALVEKMNSDYEGTQPAVPIKDAADVAKMGLNPGRRLVLPDGTMGVVPPRKKP